MKKIKIEFCDGNGEQVTVAVSGQVSRERLFQIIGLFDNNKEYSQDLQSNNIKTSMDKIIDIIKCDINNSWFTSKDISSAYIEKYHHDIKLSTISTYLTRLYNNGYLERKGNRAGWQYKLMLNINGNKEVKTFINNLSNI